MIDPLPNLVFTRDSSAWIGDQAVVASLPGPRRRENDVMAVIYGHHPRFGGLRSRYEAGPKQLDGGDVLLLAPGVVAVGVGVRTTPASVERLAKHLLDAGVVHTVLAVPMNQRGEGGHLDRVCTVVDSGVVIMVPALAFTLTALSLTCALERAARVPPAALPGGGRGGDGHRRPDGHRHGSGHQVRERPASGTTAATRSPSRPR